MHEVYENCTTVTNGIFLHFVLMAMATEQTKSEKRTIHVPIDS